MCGHVLYFANNCSDTGWAMLTPIQGGGAPFKSTTACMVGTSSTQGISIVLGAIVML